MDRRRGRSESSLGSPPVSGDPSAFVNVPGAEGSRRAIRRVAGPGLTPSSAWRAALSEPALWVALLTFVVYAPSAASVVRLNPDAVEYVDIARRLAAGEGYVLGVKANHVGEARVVHGGLAERSPLFPVVAATLFRAGGDVRAVQVLNALLAAACAALVCLIGAALFGRRAGAPAGLLAAASPAAFATLVSPMTEPLAISLYLLATWLVVRRAESPGARTLAATGVVLGLGYLARPTALAAAGALAVGALLAARRRRSALAPVGALVAGFALAAAPISLHSLATRGSPAYSGQTYLYSVFRGGDVRDGGYRADGPLPSPIDFITANADFVVAAAVENGVGYLEVLFLRGDWLLPLLPAWPLALFALVRRQYPRAAWPALLAAAGNFAVHALTWSTDQDRYQLLTLLLLLPFAIDGLSRLGLEKLSRGSAPRVTALHAAVLVVAVAWSPTFVRAYRGEFAHGDDTVHARSDRGLSWIGPPQWVEDDSLARVLDWIEARTERQDILAHGEPWPLTFFTERPATLLPTELSRQRLRTFLVEYRVAYVLLDGRDRDRRRYRDDLEALAAGGERPAAVGGYRVFDTRCLSLGVCR
jgi:4-amino-4-deoxy-L-arabinose transferase-like glycosyltransferase